MKDSTTPSRRWRRIQAFLWRTYYRASTLKEVLTSIVTRTPQMFTPTEVASAFSRWTQPAPASTNELASVKPNVETAALSIDEPDVCPYCKQKMRKTTAVGIDVFVCDSDRNVAPCPNEIVTE